MKPQELSKEEVAKAIADTMNALKNAEKAIDAVNKRFANTSGPIPAVWRKVMESTARLQEKLGEEVKVLQSLE